MKTKIIILSILSLFSLTIFYNTPHVSAGISELNENLNNSSISQNENIASKNNSGAETSSAGISSSNNGQDSAAVQVQSAQNSASESNTGFVEVNTWLNVRTGPGTNYKRIGKLYRNQKVEILETKNGWHKIKWQQASAWVCARYVSKTELSDTENKSYAGNGKKNSGAGSSNGDKNSQNSSASGQYQNTQARDGVLAVPKRSQFSNENIANGTDYRYSWCGPNSFAMVLDYYGVHKSAYECAKLVEYTFKQRAGTPISGIVHGAQKAGFDNTRLYNGQSMDWLKSQITSGKPVIVNVDVKWKGHYIVVTGFEGNNVVVNDPGKGDLSRVNYKISKETFWSYWSSKGRGAVVIQK